MPAPSADYMTAVRKAAALATSVCAVKRAEDETGLAGLVGSLPQRATDLEAPITSSRTGQHALLGGQSGLVIALVVALGMNIFAYWNSDSMVDRKSVV